MVNGGEQETHGNVPFTKQQRRFTANPQRPAQTRTPDKTDWTQPTVMESEIEWHTAQLTDESSINNCRRRGGGQGYSPVWKPGP